MITRRGFLGISAASAGLALSGCGARSLPVRTTAFPHDRFTFDGLVSSLPVEHHYEAEVEGTIPAGIRGTLYRNGPGLFERGGMRKRSLLDGDGMIRSFRFHDRGVTFRNRFVQTRKYLDEGRAGEFIYATWSTQAPGGMFANLFMNGLMNQAGVTVFRRGDSLYAFDESTLPYELDPETLETRGITSLGFPEESSVYAAHAKIDSANGEWLHFGLEQGRQPSVQVTAISGEGRCRYQAVMPRRVYMHDWFVTGKYALFNLHPGEIELFGLLTGQNSLLESLRWRPEQGNILLLLDRTGAGKPLVLQTEAAWMWHSLNAYDDGDEVVADFAGYDTPDHLIGPDAPAIAIMQGRTSQVATTPATLRRYRIDTRKGTVRQEVISSEHDFEFPFVNQRLACRRHRYGYFTCGKELGLFPLGVGRCDTATGKTDAYMFGKGSYCTEPVFVPVPGRGYTCGDSEEPGWILTEVFESSRGTSSLAVLRADRIADGPLAMVRLRHHLPISFHGNWWGGDCAG
ncbi:MAG TPA: carotenoid oxygenase family protein [Verrucomicrobiae bacterium]|nr:carotenoid oxygenase family protein [Verrucomicrobiae bacterium]